MNSMFHFPIDEVTLYQGSCKVDRKKNIPLKEGENSIIISGLPQNIRKHSVRISADGPGAVKIKNFYTEDRLKDPERDKRIKELGAELDVLKREKRNLEARLKNLTDEIGLFLFKKRIVKQFTSEAAKPINVKKWDEFFSFFREFIKKNRSANRELLFKWLDLQLKIRAAEENYAGYAYYETSYEHVACLTLEAEKEGPADIVISYFQDKVSWHPAYKLAANEKDKKIVLTLYGIVRQSTGEDWENVGLLLSTAHANASCELPSLKSRKIKEQQRSILPTPPPADSFGFAPEPVCAKNESAFDFAGGISGETLEDYDEAEDDELVPLRKEKAKVRKAAPKKDSHSILTQDEIDSLLTSVAPGSSPSPVFQDKKSKKEAKILIDGHYHKSLQMLDTLSTAVDSKIHPDLPFRELSYFHSLLENQMYRVFKPEKQMRDEPACRAAKEFTDYNRPIYSPGGFDWRYKVRSRHNRIPSLDQMVQVEVLTEEIDIELTYVTIPRERQLVYLKATLVNTTGIPFPSGPCHLVLNDTFLGSVGFDTLGVHEGNSLSLGAERDIEVQRSERVSSVTTGLVSKEIQTTYTVEIELVNNKMQEVQVEVIDGIPNSVIKKEISVEKTHFSPEPSKVNKENIVTWTIGLKAGEKKGITFGYTIKSPENFRLTKHCSAGLDKG